MLCQETQLLEPAVSAVFPQTSADVLCHTLLLLLLLSLLQLGALSGWSQQKLTEMAAAAEAAEAGKQDDNKPAS
jgi:hypothetical protein